MTLDFAVIEKKIKFTPQFDKEVLVNGVKKKQREAILAEIKEAYANSQILRDMFSDWINDHPTKAIELTGAEKYFC
jgi:hypothetical protein